MSQVIKNTIKEFVDLFAKGKQNLVAAGEVYVHLLETVEGIQDTLVKTYPNILSYKVLDAMERIGRKQILPQLLLDTSPGAGRLINLPYSDQVKYSEANVDVVVIREGKSFIERKPVRELTGAEAHRVFARNSMRDAKEQVEYISGGAPIKYRRMPYTIDGANVYFNSHVMLNLEDIEEIREKLKNPPLKGLAETIKGNQGKRR